MRFLADTTDYCDQPTTGIPSPRQILRAKLFGISVCLGTASTVPVAGFSQRMGAPFTLEHTAVKS